MYREANTKEEFEQIKSEYCDSPAPWDNKNLMTDWLEDNAELFDNNSIAIKSSKAKYLGYIDEEPVEMEISGNVLNFRLFNANEQAKEKVQDRIQAVFDDAFNDDNYNRTMAIFMDRCNAYSLTFYWAKE